MGVRLIRRNVSYESENGLSLYPKNELNSKGSIRYAFGATLAGLDCWLNISAALSISDGLSLRIARSNNSDLRIVKACMARSTDSNLSFTPDIIVFTRFVYL